MERILIIEDDLDISHLIRETLVQAGYGVVQAFSGSEALTALSGGRFDLVLLDLMLPELSGEELLESIRKVGSVPVIVLTAKVSKGSTINLLRMGADDYMTKPFDPDVLVARIQANLRRVQLTDASKIEAPSANLLKIGELEVDTDTREARLRGELLKLTVKEYGILELLMQTPKKVFTTGNIFESVWQDDFTSDTSVVKVHVSKLRQKLKAVDDQQEYVKTVWGIGFKVAEM